MRARQSWSRYGARMNIPFKSHQGIAAVLMRDNIDTDQIIPSREMKTVSRQGLGEGLFAGSRYLSPDTRETNPDFVLNRSGFETASILVSGDNFGCGSSREHAVWALKEFGFRAVIAKSFGEIFYGNCLSNGILPLTLSADDIDWMVDEAPFSLTIDLPRQIVESAGRPGWRAEFQIDSHPKRMLLEGLDPIGLTKSMSAEIADFLTKDKKGRPWLYATG